MIWANIKVYLASKGLVWTKPEDVHGRTYKYVYKKFGHKEMLSEYLHGNTWMIPKYFGRHT